MFIDAMTSVRCPASVIPGDVPICMTSPSHMHESRVTVYGALLYPLTSVHVSRQKRMSKDTGSDQREAN